MAIYPSDRVGNLTGNVKTLLLSIIFHFAKNLVLDSFLKIQTPHTIENVEEEGCVRNLFFQKTFKTKKQCFLIL